MSIYHVYEAFGDGRFVQALNAGDEAGALAEARTVALGCGKSLAVELVVAETMPWAETDRLVEETAVGGIYSIYADDGFVSSVAAANCGAAVGLLMSLGSRASKPLTLTLAVAQVWADPEAGWTQVEMAEGVGHG